jgi:short-subunit dehydrogenase
MSKFRLDGCRALITGASAGIGREFARQLAGRAVSLVLVARRRARLEELRDELTRRHPDLNVHIRETDLSDDRAVIDLFDWLENEKLSIDLLINNAGLGDLGAFATSDLRRVKEMLAVNVTALTLLTRLFLPGMIARQRGAILNVSSSAGFLPIAGFAVYAATKAYVTSFSEAIRAELHGTGVTVTALCPGPVHTEFTEVAHRSSAVPEKPSPEFTHVSVEAVVRASLEALERDKPLVIPGFLMKLAMLLVRLTPFPVLRLASRFSAKK